MAVSVARPQSGAHHLPSPAAAQVRLPRRELRRTDAAAAGAARRRREDRRRRHAALLQQLQLLPAALSDHGDCVSGRGGRDSQEVRLAVAGGLHEEGQHRDQSAGRAIHARGVLSAEPRSLRRHLSPAEGPLPARGGEGLRQQGRHERGVRPFARGGDGRRVLLRVAGQLVRVRRRAGVVRPQPALHGSLGEPVDARDDVRGGAEWRPISLGGHRRTRGVRQGHGSGELAEPWRIGRRLSRRARATAVWLRRSGADQQRRSRRARRSPRR